MTVKTIWNSLKDAFEAFFEHKILKLSAALAYYTIFSLPGLIIIIVWVGEIFYRGKGGIEGTIYKQIENLVGSDAAIQIQETIRNSALSSEGNFATIIGLITLIIGATSVFGEIQDSINQIWRLKAKPKKGRGWLKLIINRLLSFSMIISLGFLLLVSLVLNGVMDLLIDRLTQVFPQTQVILAYIVNLVLTFIMTSLLFGLIFKLLPDARIEWKHVRAGAFATAVLFMAGKFLITYYLGHSKMSSAYGAAGSIIVILLWVYFSSIILYFGAAFTRAYAICSGSHIYPNSYSVWIEQVEVETNKDLLETDKAKTIIKAQDRE
ncbi:MAG: YihY/virulence factor BrkB family protein [Chitinophagaceae bacterium]